MKLPVLAKKLTQIFIVSTIAFVVLPAQVRASDLVLPGWDLFQTFSGTSFGGVPFEGVPLGTFDFGTGPLNVDGTDTIVHRLNPATAPSTSIPTELIALQLKSSVPADFGLGLGTYYVTLQSERGGPASAGGMTVDFGSEGPVHGTFDSFFDVFFDIRLGDLNGPIAVSDQVHLESLVTPWSHDPGDSLKIVDINYHLNGLNSDNDFFPVGAIVHNSAGAAHHVVIPTPGLPDAGATVVLAGLALCALATMRKLSVR